MTVTCFRSVSENDELLGFSSTANSRVLENDSKKRKYPGCGSCLGEIILLMSEVGGE